MWLDILQKPVRTAFRDRGEVTEESEITLDAQNTHQGRQTARYQFCNKIIMTCKGYVARMRRIKGIVKVQSIHMKCSLNVR